MYRKKEMPRSWSTILGDCMLDDERSTNESVSVSKKTTDVTIRVRLAKTFQQFFRTCSVRSGIRGYRLKLFLESGEPLTSKNYRDVKNHQKIICRRCVSRHVLSGMHRKVRSKGSPRSARRTPLRCTPPAPGTRGPRLTTSSPDSLNRIERGIEQIELALNKFTPAPKSLREMDDGLGYIKAKLRCVVSKFDEFERIDARFDACSSRVRSFRC